MWKAMREWEDSIRKPYIRTQKRLMAQIKAAERNAQIERNKTKRAEAAMEKAKAATKKTKAETEKTNQRIKIEAQRAAAAKQKLEESQKENTRILNSVNDVIIFHFIEGCLQFTTDRKLVINKLMERHDLTRFEAEAYLTNFYKSLVPNGINSTQEHQSTPISPA